MVYKDKEFGKLIFNYRVSQRRRNIKKQAVAYLGGKCKNCGYNKFMSALQFHHKNPNEKDFNIAEKGRIKSFDLIKSELDKCDLLCSNCHAEEHENNFLLKLKELEKIIFEKPKPKISASVETVCEECRCVIHTYASEIKKNKRTFCSAKCKNIFFATFRWPKLDDLILMFKTMSIKDISKILNLSKSAIYKKKKELLII
jgi:hypothetical protein